MIKDYKIYIDGSGTGSPDILVLAGYIAPAKVWIDFSNAWHERLVQARMSSFKMTEMAMRPPKFTGWFYKLIEGHKLTAAVSCVLHTSALRKVADSME